MNLLHVRKVCSARDYAIGLTLALLCLTSAASRDAFAAVSTTWTGTAASNWTDPGNWSAGAPTTDIDVRFAGANASNFNDFLGLSIHSIAFISGASPFSLEGNGLSLGVGGLTNSANNTQTINFISPLSLTADQIWNANKGALAVNSAVDNGGNLLTVQGSKNTSILGAISGTGGLTKIGAGVLTLGGDNTYSGPTIVSVGVLRISHDNNLGLGDLALNGGTLQTSASIASTRGVTLTGVGGTFDSGGNDSILSGVIGGTGALTKIAAGTLTLAGANTYLGGTMIKGGAVSVSDDNNLGDASGALSIEGGALQTTSGITSARAIATDRDGMTFDSNGQDSILSGTIGGTGNLTKISNGTLTLTGANTYAGGTAINGGVVSVSADNNLGDASGALSFDGGALQTASGISSARNITTNRGGMTFDSNGQDSTLSGAISGTGNLTKISNGTLILSGANTYTGGTTVSAGVLQGDTSSLQGDILNNSRVVFDQTTSGTYAGTLSGSGSLTKQNSGTVVLSGNNTYTGGTILNGGTLSISSDNNLGGPSSDGTLADLTLIDGTLRTQAGIVSSRWINLNGDVTFDSAGNDSTLSGTINAGGSLTKISAGTLTLTGANTYSGGTAINGGVVSVSNDGNLGDASGALSFDGGALQTTSGISSARNITTNGDGMTLDSNGQDSTLSGTIGGTGNLKKISNGTLTMTGVNTYTGGTAFNGGVVSVSDDNNLGTGDLSFNGGTLQTTAGITSAKNVTLNANGGTFDSNGNDSTVSGNLTGAGPLTKISAGILTLSGDNTYSGGTTVSAGTLQGNTASLQGDITNNASVVFDQAFDGVYRGAMSGSGSLTTQNAGTLILSGANTYTGGTTVSAGVLQGNTTSLQGGILNNARVVFDQTTSGTYAGTLSGSGMLIKQNSGTLVMSGNNTYAGGTVINGGVVSIANDNNLGAAGGAVTFNGGTLLMTAGITSARNVILNAGGGTFDTDGFNSSFSGSVTGAGGLTKDGLGILTFSQGVNYSGATTVNEGTLQTAGNILGGEMNLGNTSTSLLDLNNTNLTIGSLSGGGDQGGSVTLGTATLITGGDNLNTLYSGMISGVGPLIKTGSGTFTLAGANTYTGGTSVSGGTLEGNTIGLQGNLLNNAAVVLDQGFDGTYGGAMSGIGSLTKRSTGTLTLSGENTYSGGTTVNAGILQGNTTSLQGDIANNASVVFDQAINGSYSGAMSGSGSLTKQNTGTLTLAGANTYTGGTAINGGTLSISSDNNLGTGDLSFNGGALQTTAGITSSKNVALNANGGTFDSAGFDSTLSGNLTGIGSLTKISAGTLNLSGINTYSGGTTVSAGTLQGNSASLQGDITNNASVVFDQAINGSYSGAMSGSGSLTKQNTGTLTLLGANTFTGGTNMNGGTLAVGNHGAALGSGDVKMNGGILKLADSGFGAISIGGNFFQNAGTVELKLGGGAHSGMADRLVVGGVADLHGRLQLDLVDGAFTPGKGMRIKLVQASSINAGLDVISGAAGLGLAFDPVTGDLTLSQKPLAHYAATANQQAVSGNIDQFSTTPTGDMSTIVGNLNALTPAQLPGAFNALSPQRFEMYSGVAFRSAAFTSQEINGRLARLRSGASGIDMAGMLAHSSSPSPEALLADASPHPPINARNAGSSYSISNNLGAFVSGNVIRGKLDAASDLQESNFTTSGTMGGLDYRMSDRFAAGALLSYTHTNAELDAQGSKSIINSYSPGVYATYFDGPFYWDGMLSYGRNSYTSDRNVIFGGINRTAHGTTHGNQYTANADAGYSMNVNHFKMGPTLGVEYVKLNLDGFTESGAGDADLTVSEQHSSSMRTRLGGKLERMFTGGGIAWIPEVRAAWQHEYLDDSRSITATFNQPGTGSFNVQSTSPERDSALLGAGITAQVTKNMDLYADYNAQVGQKSVIAQGVQAGGRLRF